MAEIKFQVPEWLSGLGDLPTTIPGFALAVAPVALDFFYPGTAPLVAKLIGALAGTGLMLTKGDTKPPAVEG